MSNFTDSQIEAIVERNKNLLVSASAGTGKTTVMIERVFSLIKSGEAKLDEMLIITFTKASSRDMKAKLLKKLLENEDNSFCYNAISVLSTCDISTLDSFCQKVLKTYFHVLGIDPSFKILDEAEETLIKNKVFKSVLTNLYLENKNNESLTKLISFYYKGRNEKQLSDIVFKIFRNLEVRPNKDQFKNLANKKGYNLNVSENEAFQFLCAEARKTLNKCLNITNEVLGYATDKINKKLTEDLKGLGDLLNTKDDILFFNNLMLLKIFGETKSREVDEDIKKLLSKRKKLFDAVKTMFGAETTDEIVHDLKTNKKAINLLITITNEFEKKYKEYKEKHSALDFSQVEDFAYKTLQNSSVQEELLKKYKYIFVDEYQDINELQNNIISCLNSGNTFEVGDVKQSIYGFRLTSPKIFSEKFEKYKSDESESNKLVKLNKNFRNKNNGVNKFVDNLFSVVMTSSTSGIDYKEDGKFLEKDEKWTTCVFTYIIENEKQNDEIKKVDEINPYKVIDAKLDDEITNAKREGILLAEKIKEDIKAGYKPEDISVISRTKGDALKQIVSVLNYYEIETDINYNTDLLKLPEVLILHNYLKLISNFKQDIPLAAVLLSPIYALSLNDLSKIKIKYKAVKFFHEAVLNYAESESDEIANRLNIAITDINNLYIKSQNLTISNLVREIMSEFNYLNKFKVIKDSKIENIYTYLSVLDSFASKTLVNYITETEDGSLEAKSLSSKNNAVKINTIHSSKGLDYKLVYLVLTGKKFNDKDTKDNIIISDDFGVAISNYTEEDEEDVDKKNIVLSASKIKSQKNLIMEEIRLLYVALTRAKEKLVIIGSKDEKDEELTIKTDDDVMLSKNYLQWILGVKNDAVNITKISAQNISQTTKEEHSGTRLLTVEVDNNEISEINKIIDDTSMSTSIKQKMSVSQILDLTKYFKQQVEKLEGVKVTSKDVGILYHKFLEKFNFKTNNFNEEKQRVLEKYFSADDKKLLKEEVINSIIKSDLTNLLKSGELRREQKFIFKDTYKNVRVLIIGMIDALVIKQDECIIVDYKASFKPAIKLKQTYAEQLNIYTKAISQILNTKKLSAYIYNIFTNELIKI